MSRLTRVTQKGFASTAGLDNIAQFGSLAASAPMFTTDPAVVQSLANFLEGWFAAVIGGNSPAIEDMNALFFLLFYQIRYCFQAGIPEWDAGTTYYIGSIVQDGAGNMFVSATNTNLGNPLTNTANWTPFNAAVSDNVLTTTGNSTSGSNAFTAASVAGVLQGMLVTGTNVVSPSYVLSVSGSTVYLSQNATVTGATSLVFTHSVAMGTSVQLQLNQLDAALGNLYYGNAFLIRSYIAGDVANLSLINTVSGGDVSLLSGTNVAPAILKTIDDTDLALGANNNEAMRISAAGNVGFGTMTPGVRVDSNGVIRSTNGGMISVGGAASGAAASQAYKVAVFTGSVAPGGITSHTLSGASAIIGISGVITSGSAGSGTTGALWPDQVSGSTTVGFSGAITTSGFSVRSDGSVAATVTYNVTVFYQ